MRIKSWGIVLFFFGILLAEVTVINRTFTLHLPEEYVGSANMVPGVKMTHHLVLRNATTVTASSMNLTDQIPANCHLYYSELPTVAGLSTENWVWLGVTNNTATNDTPDAVRFEITVPPLTVVTASYTVTLD